MNNKGFTLVEMLAVVVVLAIVMGIATNSVISYIDTSKKKSEKIFVDKIDNAIEGYIDLYKGNIVSSTEPLLIKNVTFQKCRVNSSNCKDSSVNEVGTFEFRKVLEEGFLDSSSLINPKNKKKCNFDNNKVRVFRDSEFVYYYYFDTSSLGCDIENKVITNIPSNLCSELFNKDSNLICG